MAKFDIEGSQNVEVSKKIPCEKPLLEQLLIMEEYTAVHKAYKDAGKEKQELECLKVIYPRMFRSIEEGDLIAGRLDFLPIGFGTVTSVGGVGHYCVFNKLRAFQKEIEKLDNSYHDRVEKLYEYWVHNDLKTAYCEEILTDTTIGRFIDTNYPLIATARLSGMMLDYPKLLNNGVNGLIEIIEKKLHAYKETKALENDNKVNNDSGIAFLENSIECLKLVTESADAMSAKAEALLIKEPIENEKRRKQLSKMIDSLNHIRTEKPRDFVEALQLFWLYALLAGVINYGRLDDFLGLYLAADIENGRITEQEAYEYIKSLWAMIESRRTTVNGRIIVGGKGRMHPKEADVFAKIALQVCRDCRYVESQFTLRVTRETSDEFWNIALDVLSEGATYPTIYNDDVNVDAVSYGMRVDKDAASRYVPFGCTEFVLWGQSTGTPNICINLLKLLTIYMNDGIDPVDGLYRIDDLSLKKMSEIESFEEFYDGFKKLLDYYMDLSVNAQYRSYEIMNERVSFLFTSILMDDCIDRAKAVLDGGVRYLGGTCETYGNINTSDSLWAVKHLVFDTKQVTLSELNNAMLCNFSGYEQLRKKCINCDKYGNDLDTADDMANDFYEFVAKGIRDRGIKVGMQYFLIVISNNSLNTEWGEKTGASPDGRLAGMYMNPANNPQGGADKNGPTALLNSLSKFDAKYHAGSVQNIKFEKGFFKQNKNMIRMMLQTYFDKGGCHIMVTSVDKGALEDAMIHPEKYPDLIVRVAGYSAVFVNLDKHVQKELLSRSMYGEG